MDAHFYNRTARDLLSVHTIQPLAAVTTTGDITTTSGNFVSSAGGLIAEGPSTLNGTLELTSVLNDDTETKLLVLDSATNIAEYRNVSSLPVVNPFDQPLNTFNEVDFEGVTVRDVGDGSYLDITTDNNSTGFVSKSDFTGPKEVLITHSTSGLTTFKLANSSINSGSQAQLNIDSKDDSYISFRDDGVSQVFHAGLNNGANEFRITHGDNGMDSPVALSVDLAENVLVNKLEIFTMSEDFTNNQEKIMVWDSTAKTVFWRDVANLPVVTEFPIITVDSGMLEIDTFIDNYVNFTMTPISNIGSKFFQFIGDSTSTLAAVFRNENNGASANSAILLQSAAGSGGNQVIIYETVVGENWTTGRQEVSNEFHWDYDPIGSKFLVGNTTNKMKLTPTGDLTLLGDITLGGGNAQIRADDDSLISFIQTPAITTGYKQLAFVSTSSDFPVIISITNSDLTATAHTGILLHNSSVGGGNQFTIHETPSENQWVVGRQRTTDTFRWNNSASGSDDFLTNDANTKMFLDSSGNLDIDGTLSMNSSNLIINAADDSSTLFTQTPSVTTGAKRFVFTSDTSNSLSGLFVDNNNADATAHSGIYIRTDRAVCTGNGGNQLVIYESCGLNNWSVGRQKTTGDFRWNFMGGGTDNLTNDANTKMFLDTNGNLDIDGTLSLNNNNLDIIASSDGFSQFYQTPAVTTGTKIFAFDTDTSGSALMQINNYNTAVTGHAAINIATDATACSGNGGNQSIYYHRCGAGGWSVGRQVSTDTFRWNYNAAVDPNDLNSDLDTKMHLTGTGDLTLTSGQLFQQAEVVSLTSIPATTFIIDAITTRYTWTSARGNLTMGSLGQANWSVNAATGIAQLANWDDLVGTYFCMVNFSCAIRTSAGVDQEIEIVCHGNALEFEFIPSAVFGVTTQVVKNTADWHNVSFNSLCVIQNTGWFEFAFANLSSNNNIEIKNARATMYKG